jgi:hypothetical protein
MYLILTTCLENRYSLESRNERVQRYLFAIQETLKYTPSHITPIIVENNGERPTELDHFQHFGKHVKVVYTTHNQQNYRFKGMNEWLDIQYVVQQLGLESEWIVKLTGRYYFISSHFFNEVAQSNSDAIFKFYNVHRREWDRKECVLGSFAMKGDHILRYGIRQMEFFQSPERAISAYVKYSMNYESIDKLDVSCCFAEDSLTLLV